LLCGDLNARIGGLDEVTHARWALPVAHPAPRLAHQYKCQAIAAGRLLADLASYLNGILGSCRVWEENGQASFLGSPGQEVASQPNHVLISRAFSGHQMVCRFRQHITSVIIA